MLGDWRAKSRLVEAHSINHHYFSYYYHHVNALVISLLVVRISVKYIDFIDQYQYPGQNHFISG